MVDIRNLSLVYTLAGGWTFSRPFRLCFGVVSLVSLLRVLCDGEMFLNGESGNHVQWTALTALPINQW